MQDTRIRVAHGVLGVDRNAGRHTAAERNQQRCDFGQTVEGFEIPWLLTCARARLPGTSPRDTLRRCSFPKPPNIRHDHNVLIGNRLESTDISTSRVCHRNEGHAPIRSPLAVFFAVIPGNSGLGSVALGLFTAKSGQRLDQLLQSKNGFFSGFFGN
jgi:hypothetical protein